VKRTTLTTTNEMAVGEEPVYSGSEDVFEEVFKVE
jgi:hypothetical protein